MKNINVYFYFLENPSVSKLISENKLYLLLRHLLIEVLLHFLDLFIVMFVKHYLKYLC